MGGVGPVRGGELGEDVFVFFVGVGGWLGSRVEGGHGEFGAEGEEEGHFSGCLWFVVLY